MIFPQRISHLKCIGYINTFPQKNRTKRRNSPQIVPWIAVYPRKASLERLCQCLPYQRLAHREARKSNLMLEKFKVRAHGCQESFSLVLP